MFVVSHVPHISVSRVALVVGYAHHINVVLQAPFVCSNGWRDLPLEQRRFNIRMSRVRVTAEWMFRDITSTWQYLKTFYSLRVKQQPVGRFYIVAADLTNMRTILRGGGNTSRYFDCPPPTLEEYVAPRVYIDRVNAVVEDMAAVAGPVHDADDDEAGDMANEGIEAALDAYLEGDDDDDDRAIVGPGFLDAALLARRADV